MALTEAEEAALKTGLEETKKLLGELTPVVSALKAEVAAKDTVIKDLQSKTDLSTQERAVAALKAKFPDVPTETLLAIPEASREAQGKVLQETMGKLKGPQSGLKTGPDAWGNVGGVGPSAEAEDHAALAARQAARDKAVQTGNLMEVLRLKSRDTVEFVQTNFSRRG